MNFNRKDNCSGGSYTCESCGEKWIQHIAPRSTCPTQEIAEVIATRQGIEIIAKHYLTAAVWADCEDGTNPRITKEAKKYAIAAARDFICRIGADLYNEIKHAHGDYGYGTHADCGAVLPWCAAMGHDLWLTRQHHGTGFWDRDELKANGLGDKLTEVAHAMGEAEYWQHRGWFYLG